MAECEHTADCRPTESFEFEPHLVEKASQMYVLVTFSSFSLNVMLFSWHKVDNIAQILISNVKLPEGPKRSSLFKSFSVNEEILFEKQRDVRNMLAHDQHQQFLLPKSPAESQSFDMVLPC